VFVYILYINTDKVKNCLKCKSLEINTIESLMKWKNKTKGGKTEESTERERGRERERVSY
jgi:hypothetical protein